MRIFRSIAPLAVALSRRAGHCYGGFLRVIRRALSGEHGGQLYKSSSSVWRNHAFATSILVLLIASSTTLCSQDQPLDLNMATVAVHAEADSWETKRAHQESEAAKWVARRTASMRWGRAAFDSHYLRLDDPIVVHSPTPALMIPFVGPSVLTPLAPQDNLHVRFEGAYPLFTGGKITYGIREAKAGARAAKANESKTDAEVVYEAERNYLSVLLARDILKLNQDALGSYKEHLDHANSQYRIGTAAKYDVIRAEAAVSDQEKKVIESQNQVDLAEAALRTSLVLSDDQPITVTGCLFEIDDPAEMTPTIAAAVQSSPALKALNEKISSRKSEVHVQAADYLPQITALAGREMVTSKLAQTDPTWFAGARLKLELLDGGERHARVGEAKANLLDSQYEYRHAEEQIRLAVRSAVLDLRAQRATLTSARKTAELAQESLRLATKRFEVGTGTSLEVLDATVAVTSSRVGVQRALYGIDISYLTIHRYQGDIAEVAARIQR